MYTQNDLVKFAIYAERSHRLAFDIAIQAAQLGDYGSGLAQVADECRNIGLKLKLASDRLYNNEEVNITESLFQLESMALNGCIEALRVNDSNFIVKPTKPVAVIFDEIVNLSNDIKTLFKYRTSEFQTYTRVSPRNSVLFGRLPFLQMRIGSQCFTENLQFVREVFRFNDVKDGKILVRNRTITVLDTSKILEKTATSPEFLVIINADFSQDEDNIIALPVDCLPIICWNDIGTTSQVASDIPKEIIRECWNCEEDNQMLFLNYTYLN